MERLRLRRDQYKACKTFGTGNGLSGKFAQLRYAKIRNRLAKYLTSPDLKAKLVTCYLAEVKACDGWEEACHSSAPAASRDDDKMMQNGSCEIYEDELAKHMLDEFLFKENLVLL